MSSSNNGTTVLKSLSDLGSAIDIENLPAGPTDSADDSADTTHLSPLSTEQPSAGGRDIGASIPDAAVPPTDQARQPLAALIAQLADMSSGLEAMVRQDARARELASIELAQYETLAAERREAERALADARQVRAAAEHFVGQAFSDELRARAAQHAATARAAELACAQLLAERIRAADELASRPHLARVLADRRRGEQQRAEVERHEAAARAQRRAEALERASQALHREQPEEALALLRPLAAACPTDTAVHRLLDTAAWQTRRRVVAPAEEALRDVRSRAYRQDPEQATARLASVAMDGLPDDLARQMFGIWSELCLKVVRQRGWIDPERYAPRTSRGMVFARATAEGPFQVVSALGLSDWHAGDTVTSPAVLRTARPLQERKRTAADAS